ncbi:hypothetical protein ACME8T_07975 [Morganella morganii]|uniref:hypothetical protein n=1 Tax=Morganella morganii TaxID=582 RepID=UPI003D00E8C0
MGTTKEWVMQVEEDRREEWIRARLSDPDLEDDSEEWQQLEDEYNSLNEFLEDIAREAYEEQLWLENTKFTDIYDEMINILNEIKNEKPICENEITIKMKIAYGVTIMESCLGEMIKNICISDNRYIINAICNIDELKNKKIHLKELLDTNNTAKQYVQQYLSSVLYHNIPKVIEVYSAILQPKENFNINQENIIKLMLLRHDIVHRNGKKTNGEKIEFKSCHIEKHVSTIMDFLNNIKSLTINALQEHNN